jgi:hypothetical protein
MPSASNMKTLSKTFWPKVFFSVVASSTFSPTAADSYETFRARSACLPTLAKLLTHVEGNYLDVDQFMPYFVAGLLSGKRLISHQPIAAIVGLQPPVFLHARKRPADRFGRCVESAGNLVLAYRQGYPVARCAYCRQIFFETTAHRL